MGVMTYCGPLLLVAGRSTEFGGCHDSLTTPCVGCREEYRVGGCRDLLPTPAVGCREEYRVGGCNDSANSCHWLKGGV